MLERRREIWERALWDAPWKRLVYPFLGLLGFAQMVRDEFVEEPTRTEWTAPHLIPWLEQYWAGWPWWAWFLILLFLALVILVEGSYQEYRRAQQRADELEVGQDTRHDRSFVAGVHYVATRKWAPASCGNTAR